MTETIYICDHRSEPADTECYVAVWEQGEACEDCKHDCYRAGWAAARVTRDNEERVRRKLEGIAGLGEGEV